MAKRNIFRTQFTNPLPATDPEALFRDLRSPFQEIQHLWSHQADLLRDYMKYVQASDVAIGLPTGSGKTLVGVLIGEWRRQSRQNRVAYLCPTRQLARQVGSQAIDYGIEAHVLVGKQSEYAPHEFNDYQTGKAIAITTYSAIFNSSPRFKDPQTLVLDDAHAGENFLASMWSVEISRSTDPDTYRAILDLVQTDLDSGFYSDISSGWDVQKANLIELIPNTSVRKHETSIRDFLDKALESKTSPWYAWNLVKDSLVACNFFVSWDSILIRPLIPPTLTHPPFKNATQRVYMSATLGSGGELERIVGVKSITRLALPKGCNQHSSGRRLFLMPQYSMTVEQTNEVVENALKKFERSLVLVPNRHDPEAIRLSESIQRLNIPLFGASDIENDINRFVGSASGALLLSRYDGLDLPDDSCRLLVFGGLPSGTNLQERFLWSRIAASTLLRDRVMTRFVQGVGRCIRSDSDYAVVLVIGKRLLEFVLKNENLDMLSPELQAEIKFGIENSRDRSAQEINQLLDSFLAQDEGWRAAETTMERLCESSRPRDGSISNRLRSVVTDEISYLYAMWERRFENALQYARKVTDALSGEGAKAYRAWWYYLSAEAALKLFETTSDTHYKDTAHDLLNRAAQCSIGIGWFARLGQSLNADCQIPEVDHLVAVAVENIRNSLLDWGFVGPKFEEHLQLIQNNISEQEPNRFHQGLKDLGEMLGFHSEIPTGNATPDCIWSIGNQIHVAHEAKSKHNPKNAIGVNDVRQAQSHDSWIRAKLNCDQNVQVLCLIESPRQTIDPEAITFANSLCHVAPSELKELFNESAAILRRVRSKISSLSDEKILEELLYELTAQRLTPFLLFERLSQRPVKAMETGHQKYTSGSNQALEP